MADTPDVQLPGVQGRIAQSVASHPVMLFMKGTPEAPQCGFSAKVVQILGRLVPGFASADVLADPQLRSGIKAFSDWPTVPQLYVKGEFVGGADIIEEMYASGELHGLLGVDAPAAMTPTVHVTPGAAELLHKARGQGAADGALHLSVDARFRYQLGFGARQGGELEIQSGEFTFLLDPESALRADGMILETVDTPEGPRLTIQNPNAPRVSQLGVQQLKELSEGDQPFELFDVRTPEEIAKARIPAARHFDDDARAYIDTLPRDTPLIFHCHHGGRSQAAAEHYAAAGFTAVANLIGGIDAWSQEIDPSVPRY